MTHLGTRPSCRKLGSSCVSEVVDRNPSSHDAPVEEWLRASRPEPSPAFVRGLEERLLPRERRAPRPSRRPLFAGMAAALGTAGVVLVLALAGAGPFTQGGDDVNAKDNCRFVPVTRVESVPRIVEHAGGPPTIRYRKQTVHRRVRRCR